MFPLSAISYKTSESQKYTFKYRFRDHYFAENTDVNSQWYFSNFTRFILTKRHNSEIINFTSDFIHNLNLFFRFHRHLWIILFLQYQPQIFKQEFTMMEID
jgi:hypothetical protein